MNEFEMNEMAALAAAALCAVMAAVFALAGDSLLTIVFAGCACGNLFTSHLYRKLQS